MGTEDQKDQGQAGNDLDQKDGGTGSTGLTTEEQAQFDAMASGGAVPGAEAFEPEAGDGGNAADKGEQQQPPVVSKRVGEAAAGESDEADDGDGADGGAAAGTAAADGAGDHQGSKKRVSYFKFQRSEERAAKAEQRAREIEEKFARGDERTRILLEALRGEQGDGQKKQQDEDPRPDPEEDIFGYSKWQERQLEKLGKAVEQLQSGNQQSREEQEIATTYLDDAMQFQQGEPNFVPAYTFLANGRLAELAAMASIDPRLADARHRKKVAMAEERDLVTGALKRGQSPAKAMYDLALARGYKPEAAQGDQGAGSGAAAAQNGRGTTLAAGAGNGTAAAASVQDEIARIKSGTASSQSLSNGGGVPISALTPEALANLPQDQFDELVQTLPKSRIRELLGS